MAEISVLGDKLSRLLRASGWTVQSQRFTINATEPAFEPVARTWMAGAARSLSDSDIYAANPSRIIVDDLTPADQIQRLEGALDALGNGGAVSTYSRFVDEFWGASTAVEAALADADSSDAELLFEVNARGMNDRHVIAHVELGSLSVPDHRALESGLPAPGTCMAVLADAGMGKTELLRWHEWRYASQYNSALQSRRPVDLPPVALRVPLRDFKSLSLDYVAHNLSQPAQDRGRPPLPRISSGAVLRELVIQQRLILLLDGLDEVSADSATVDEGISEWRTVVREGGHFVLTSRDGHESSRGTIARRFEQAEIASVKPLERGPANQLLTKRGASEAGATRVVDALAGPSAGIPLFLLLANHVGLDTRPNDDVARSRTMVLLTLLRLFCERDEDRLGVSADEQIEVLTQIAEWSMELGPLTQDDLLRNLGIDESDAIARIVKNPHALLSNRSGRIEFKFAEFDALFTARAIAEAWQSYGYKSVVHILKKHNLNELVVEYLARLLQPAVISGAWVASENESDGVLLLRRNLLAAALARVADVAHGESPNARSTELAKVLGNRSISNLSISGLYLDRFDFTGWSIRRLHGHGGTLSYCENLWRTVHDESVELFSLDGCSFHPPAAAEINIDLGVERLRRLIRPMRRRKGGAVKAIMSKPEASDLSAWDLLVRLELATPSGKATSARWTLNAEGLRMLTAFSMAEGTSDSALTDLVEADQDVRALVTQLSRRRNGATP